MDFTPSPIQTLALWRLLFSDDPAPMQSRLKPRLTPAQRKELADAGLICLSKRGRAFYVELTEKAWAWAEKNLDAPFSRTVNAAAPFACLLSALKRHMAAENIPLTEILRPKENGEKHKKAETSRNAVSPGRGIRRGKDHEKDQGKKRIKAACLEASGGRLNVRIRLARLREIADDIPPRTLEAIIRDMQLDGTAVLYPLDDPSEITPEDEAAAVLVMGRKNHILYMTSM
ncbi:conserved hypothetical protein [Candidatus Desulfarcum epimagneticum]|uniref:Uncharacterized protein n=1 Tax=uncultured Desulfobacteraceae bacterium TaxID=218296 RepID=A0A484HNI0_9BACT|nr:conserved hypothetical protein [uncultured Desulfobacteraceae bacterium]